MSTTQAALLSELGRRETARDLVLRVICCLLFNARPAKKTGVLFPVKIIKFLVMDTL